MLETEIDVQYVQAFQALEKFNGSKTDAARSLGIARSTLRDRLEKYTRAAGLGQLPVAPKNTHPDCINTTFGHEFNFIAFSDSHIWPGKFSPAFYVLCQILEHVQPDLIIDGGDFFDGASVSRHPASGGYVPSVKEELLACREASDLITGSSPDSVRLRIPGNHGDRLAKYVAGNAPELDGMDGTAIEHYFGDWQWAHSHMVQNSLLVCHNWKGGLHAGHNNAMQSGVSMATGHDHKLKAYPIDDLRGRRWGIHMGTLQDIYAPQFAYMQHRPRDWASGFVYAEMTTDGRVYPELIHVEPDGSARWRGKVWRG